MCRSTISAKRGRFVVFEGLDAVGKTTTATSYARTHQATFVSWLQEPFRSMIRELWRRQADGAKISKNSEHLVFLSALRHLSDVVSTLLATGTDVVVDRYFHSSIAVHAPLAEHFGESPIHIGEELIGIVMPDCCIQLCLEEKFRLLRASSDADRVPSPVEVLLETELLFNSRVRENFSLQCSRGLAVELHADGMTVEDVVASAHEKILENSEF
jgi:thymidylate kinase